MLPDVAVGEIMLVVILVDFNRALKGVGLAILKLHSIVKLHLNLWLEFSLFPVKAGVALTVF